jgi:predicted phosphoadenosine phosphosulfate sulfurtransferase
MRILSKQNVYDKALERIRYLFDEFENVVVGFSGGKDSTIIFNLAMIVAKEKNRLPLNVLWIDQEVEWIATSDFCEYIMTLPDVKPYWYQMEMVITNNASSFDRYNYCWKKEDEAEWVRPKHPLSIKENPTKVQRFHDLFGALMEEEFKGQTACYLSGVRTEESPNRFMALTYDVTYKWITWGKRYSKKRDHFSFYPIYDWSYTDVWKAINDNHWRYNTVYDSMYRHGCQYGEMRVSNLHHETAINTLLIVQQIEPQLWSKITNRIAGANTVKHIKDESFHAPKELPHAFEDWEEYALYLAEHLIQPASENPKDPWIHKRKILKQVELKKKIFDTPKIREKMFKVIVTTILSSDWDLTKLNNWFNSHEALSYKDYKKGKISRHTLNDIKYFSEEQQKDIMEKLGGSEIKYKKK